MAQDVKTTTAEVFMHHIQALKSVDMDALISDYSEDSVVMLPERSFNGPAEIRAFFEGAIASLPPGFVEAMTPIRSEFSGEVAYLVWHAEPFLKVATDTFVIRDGKIMVQTILM
jgi:ketosteroid isomerase-like protein